MTGQWTGVQDSALLVSESAEITSDCNVDYRIPALVFRKPGDLLLLAVCSPWLNVALNRSTVRKTPDHIVGHEHGMCFRPFVLVSLLIFSDTSHVLFEVPPFVGKSSAA
ncbi:hypothetical protein MGYG_03855 [Nannizzia gypsea CBS 118893]|uniref:Uncharacterized protein n=1 Tax=Arthroderma gypseum (strain ATCC MYA-4604 / CBS 118893) TaxID=535722 RepID=E4UU82_ARTGP|nr:hypothetical protein MGYG_03855 [Nannizzia gypsea CBS 118893]EFR00849.1 hypothetical protein MGYG_03855 [Nannizzia gypsea CBS 118893]